MKALPGRPELSAEPVPQAAGRLEPLAAFRALAGLLASPASAAALASRTFGAVAAAESHNVCPPLHGPGGRSCPNLAPGRQAAEAPHPGTPEGRPAASAEPLSEAWVGAPAAPARFSSRGPARWCVRPRGPRSPMWCRNRHASFHRSRGGNERPIVRVGRPVLTAETHSCIRPWREVPGLARMATQHPQVTTGRLAADRNEPLSRHWRAVLGRQVDLDPVALAVSFPPTLSHYHQRAVLDQRPAKAFQGSCWIE